MGIIKVLSILFSVLVFIGVMSVIGVSAIFSPVVANAEPTAVPFAWQSLEIAAAKTCPGLSWTVLGSIALIESDSGQSPAPGVQSGTNQAGAMGPMQFEPATFAQYAVVGPGGAIPPSPYNSIDAMYTAAHMLCVDGASNASTLSGAVWSYNHSNGYVASVLALAQALSSMPNISVSDAQIVLFAANQIGVPYKWGGTNNSGFDCSGLTQAAYNAGGILIPRTAQQQFNFSPPIPFSLPVQPGDLVYFGASTSAIEHVGIFIGKGDMIDAPHQGAKVRIDSATWSNYVGANSPVP